MQESKSTVAQFRQEQALQEQAAQQGLCGFAVVARHDLIIARMEQAAGYLLNLVAAGKHKEVQVLLETPTWGLEEDAASCPTTTTIDEQK